LIQIAGTIQEHAVFTSFKAATSVADFEQARFSVSNIGAVEQSSHY